MARIILYQVMAFFLIIGTSDKQNLQTAGDD